MKHNPPKNKYQSKAIRQKYRNKKKANKAYNKRSLPPVKKQPDVRYIQLEKKEGMENYNDINSYNDIAKDIDHYYGNTLYNIGDYCLVDRQNTLEDIYLQLLLKDYEIIEISDYQ